jgi:hypothetical protein
MSVLIHNVEGLPSCEPQHAGVTATRTTPFCAYNTLASELSSACGTPNSEPAGNGDPAEAAIDAGGTDAGGDGCVGAGGDGCVDGGGADDAGTGIAEAGADSDAGAAIDDGAPDAGPPACPLGTLPQAANAAATTKAPATRSFTTTP